MIPGKLKEFASHASHSDAKTDRLVSLMTQTFQKISSPTWKTARTWYIKKVGLTRYVHGSSGTLRTFSGSL